jgi:hypothetical protein
MHNASTEEGRSATYYTYLLRLWREGEGGEGWRASLHDPRSGERLGFGSVEELFAFLEGQMEAAPGTESGPEGSWERR